MKLETPDFDKRAYLKKLESLVYLILMVPLFVFAFVYLETEQRGGLRSSMPDQADWMFHGVMGTAVVYILMRTVGTWRRDIVRALEDTPQLDVKLQRLFKPIIYRNILWALGAGVGAYGIYEKGDMLYAAVFTLFLVLITTNRPTGKYFSRFLRLKGEEKAWMEDRKLPDVEEPRKKKEEEQE